jgi:hypothetical protein
MTTKLTASLIAAAFALCAAGAFAQQSDPSANGSQDETLIIIVPEDQAPEAADEQGDDQAGLSQEDSDAPATAEQDQMPGSNGMSQPDAQQGTQQQETQGQPAQGGGSSQ